MYLFLLLTMVCYCNVSLCVIDTAKLFGPIQSALTRSFWLAHRELLSNFSKSNISFALGAGSITIGYIIYKINRAILTNPKLWAAGACGYIAYRSIADQEIKDLFVDGVNLILNNQAESEKRNTEQLKAIRDELTVVHNALLQLENKMDVSEIKHKETLQEMLIAFNKKIEEIAREESTRISQKLLALENVISTRFTEEKTERDLDKIEMKAKMTKHKEEITQVVEEGNRATVNEMRQHRQSTQADIANLEKFAEQNFQEVASGIAVVSNELPKIHQLITKATNHTGANFAQMLEKTLNAHGLSAAIASEDLVLDHDDKPIIPTVSLLKYVKNIESDDSLADEAPLKIEDKEEIKKRRHEKTERKKAKLLAEKELLREQMQSDYLLLQEQFKHERESFKEELEIRLAKEKEENQAATRPERERLLERQKSLEDLLKSQKEPDIFNRTHETPIFTLRSNIISSSWQSITNLFQQISSLFT